MSQELVDVMPFDYQLVESSNGGLRVEGVFQRSDTENANKRVYPRSIWETQLGQRRIQESLEKRAMFGELDHPSDGKTKLSRVSHVITGLKLESDGTVTGAADILENTPNGQILKALFEAGTQVGISSRGSGSVSNGVVGNDFKLTTFDFVARPSTPGAIPTPASGPRHEDLNTVDNTIETVDDLGIDDDDPLFQEFLKELNASDSYTESEPLTEDFDGLMQRVLQLRQSLYEANDVRPYVPEFMHLSEAVYGCLGDDTVPPDFANALKTKLEESRQILFGLDESEQLTEEQTIEEDQMDRTDFIKNRLREVQDLQEEQMVDEAVELEQEIDNMNDDELIELASELGLIEAEDTNGDDMNQEMLYDEQDILEYAQELEVRLEEATNLINELALNLEENESDTAIKYEATLGVLNETIIQYQMLQEAVGGQDRADKLLEAHLVRLEKNVTDDATADDVTEDFDDIEDLLSEDTMDTQMRETKRLAEGALERLGLN